MTAPQAAPVTSPREEWDRLVERRAQALAGATDDYTRQGLTPGAARKAAEEDGALILASGLEFADAVDRSGKGMPYAEAVVIEGSAGPVVITETEWRDNPAYWRTVAAGGNGRIDRVEAGRLLLHYLHTGEDVEDPPGAHRAP